MLYREWKIHRPQEEVVRALEQAGIGPLLAGVLAARGVDTPEKAAAALQPAGGISDPFLLLDMDKAVDRIHEAIDSDEGIVIFGDYDVDGITATALLFTCLADMGARVFYKIASRADDGYGLTPGIVEQVAARGIGLIITVDNGTSAVEAARRAAELGVDLVITDHHLPPDTLPEAVALVNPCRGEDGPSGAAENPFVNFSGVGVVFLLAAALTGCAPADLLGEYGDLAAVGTVADVMRLTGENRVLVREGLAALGSTARPGLAALLRACGLEGEVTAENISYALAPRLNAAGRMDDATDALRLLLAEDEEEAEALVARLQEQNTARQKAEAQITAEICAMIDADPALQRARVLVVWGEAWPQGIIGVVSSRLVDRYAKPAIVISLEGGEGRGSGRSVHGFSLYSAIASCSDLLIRYGGHDLAAGLSIAAENLPAFRARIAAWAAEHSPVFTLPELVADVPVRLDQLTLAAVEELDRLAPFGSGNPAPRFALPDAVVDGVYPISEGRHSRIRLRQQGAVLSTVYFGQGPAQLPYKEGDRVDALLSLSVYRGRGEPQVSARIIELRPAGLGNEHVAQSALFESFSAGVKLQEEARDILCPSRDDTAAVYRAVRDNGGVYYTDTRPVFQRLGEKSTARILTALAALEELGLICRSGDSGRYETVPVKEKRDLNQSALLRRLEV